MKVRNILLSIAVISVLGANAATTGSTTLAASVGGTTNLSSQSIDELAKQMQKADPKDRYEYMNAIKEKLSKMNNKERASKISEMENHMQTQKEDMQSDMEERSSHNNMDGEDSGMENHSDENSVGMGSGMGGMGSSEGGMGGGEGGGSGGEGGGHGGEGGM